MKAISVRQPEAWLIINGMKDVENRGWATSHRGWLLIHASKKAMTKSDWEWLTELCELNGRAVPTAADVQCGGIVGLAHLADCVESDTSEWFEGPVGWILTDTQPLPFHPAPGRLGLFDMSGYELNGDFLTIPE